MKIRIAIYSAVIPSTTFIERLIIGLANEGYEVVLFGKYQKRVSYKQTSIRVLGNRHGVLGIVQLVGRLFSLLVTNPDRFFLLRKHLGYGPFSGKRGLGAWQKYLPFLLQLPDVFHLQWARSAEEWLFLKKLFGVKLIVSLRGTHINTSPLANVALAESYRRAFKQYDAFHGVSYAIVQEAARYGVDEKRANVIYSGLPYRPLPESNSISNERIRIVAVGRFHWKKGYHYLLDALAILKAKQIHFKLTLIAQGEMPEEIVYQLHDLNLETEVTWIKGLPYREVEAQMLMHNVLVLPSVEEGIANVVLEAMQMGLPVVSTNCGGMDEVITHVNNGLLIPVRNPEAIAEAILSVKEFSPEKKDQLRQKANESISKKFNLERNIQQFGALYASVLS